jgi:hypothetical protein
MQFEQQKFGMPQKYWSSIWRGFRWLPVNLWKMKLTSISTSKISIWHPTFTKVHHKFNSRRPNIIFTQLRFNQLINLWLILILKNHSGTLNSGHYTSYVKNQQKEWLYFDDENCTGRPPSNMVLIWIKIFNKFQNLQSKQAFLLYYALDTESGYGKNMI